MRALCEGVSVEEQPPFLLHSHLATRTRLVTEPKRRSYSISQYATDVRATRSDPAQSRKNTKNTTAKGRKLKMHYYLCMRIITVRVPHEKKHSGGDLNIASVCQPKIPALFRTPELL